MSYLGEQPVTYFVDLNGDGHLDEITFSADPQAAVEPYSNLSISYGGANGYTPGPVLKTPFGVNSISFADLNNGGFQDIILTSNFFDGNRSITGYNNTSVTIFYASGSNSYYAPYSIPIGDSNEYPVGVSFTPASAGQLDIIVQFSDGTSTTLYPATGGTYVACFAQGTRITVPTGIVAVELLAIGDHVTCQFRGSAKVKWIGRRSIACRQHPRPQDVLPVQIDPDAFGPGAPARHLLLSPDHAVFVDGLLVPVRYLVNGASIAQIDVPSVTYWHVELEGHDVLLAEGLPTESYLDTGNRSAFSGEAGPRPLHPDLAARKALAIWHERACGPLALDGPALSDVRACLLRRTSALGYAVTGESALRILADGVEVPLFDTGPLKCSAVLPAGTQRVALVSRAFVPAWFSGSGGDERRLGIAVTDLCVDGRRVPGPAYGEGWHAAEPGWRWTNGNALLRLSTSRHSTVLSISTATAGARYWSNTPHSLGRTSGEGRPMTVKRAATA